VNAPRASGAEKRRAYVFWFCMAFAVDLLWGLYRGGGYQPSMVGLAIMITAVLFFAWSWLRER
jgi:hypothetical protein